MCFCGDRSDHLHFALPYRANQRSENQGLGVDRPDEVSKEDDEFDAYRKRMMLAYRFRPNPLVSTADHLFPYAALLHNTDLEFLSLQNNPRRPYY